jgi:hypothetical protein
MEERFLFDRIDSNAGNIAGGDIQDSILIGTDLADAIPPRSDFAAMSTGIAQDPRVWHWLEE